jgi:hypothetical protein
MDFRTELSVQPSPWKFGLQDSLFTLGSCFAQSIGQRLTDNKFRAMVNPFGTTYHPFAIHKLLRYASFHGYPTEHTYLVNRGIHYNYDFHSSLADRSKANLQKQIEEHIAAAHHHLKDCRVALLTYGTAWLYQRADTHEPVANCHKMPAADFTRRLVSVDEIVDSFDSAFKSIEPSDPKLQFILTVSPVRHLNDTLPLNNVSKSTLRLACHQLSEKYKHVHYFPAYEIIMDDLRDYRFYESDLIHPSPSALEYIWQKFIACYCDQSTLQVLAQWNELRKALAHKPFQAESDSHRTFLINTLKKLEELKSQIDVQSEINQLKSQLGTAPHV